MADVDVRTNGPVFDGRADRALRDFEREADKEITDAGVRMVQDELAHVIRHPTGRYESSIHGEMQTELSRIITDGGIVYGPWLEGTGSRNRTTRFKGYFTFRRIGQRLEAKSGEIAERVLRRYIGRMEV